MQRTVNLPVGPRPGWELEEDADNGESELRSPCDSHVVFQSLKQSRNKWMFSTFPKFSAKARGGKPAEVVAPPHSVKAHGRYDMEIGPHIFPNTAFYEVHYIPQVLGGIQPIAHTQNTSVPTTITTPGLMQSATTIEQLSASSSAGYVATHATPALISQVNAASLSNPTLANLLRLAAVGSATSDQLKTLGLLIQSLDAMQSSSEASPPQAPPNLTHVVPPQSGPSPVTREFDIVIEFQERSSDRWIIPRGPAVCERVDSLYGTFDVLLSTSVPFPGVTPPRTPEISVDRADSPLHVVPFRLVSLSEGLWDTLLTWAGGMQGMEASKKILDDMRKKAPKRSYLQHQISDDLLHSQIQAALTPPYSTKSIVPGNADGTKPKRKAASRKAANKSTDSPSTAIEKGPLAKRRQVSKQQASATPLIACRACGQTDVPLMMGGRYCRPCIDAGKAVNDIPQVGTSATGSLQFLSTGPSMAVGSSTERAAGAKSSSTSSLSAPPPVASSAANPAFPTFP